MLFDFFYIYIYNAANLFKFILLSEWKEPKTTNKIVALDYM